MKEFYSYEKQIEKLHDEKGLIIEDENQTIEALKFEGYYNIINGYSKIFKDKTTKAFYKSTTFNHIRQLYLFDKKLRAIVYNYTTSIENHIKALIAHEFSKVHGVDEKTYLKISCFNTNEKNIDNVNRLIEECNQTIKDALNVNSNKYRKYIAHNFETHNHVPLWVLIRALSFGTTSIFYKSMHLAEQSIIASYFKLTSPQLANFLEVVVSFRNIVAHSERTFCARLPKTRLTTKLDIVSKLNIPQNQNNSNKFGRNDLLSLIICFKYLLSPMEFSEFFLEFSVILDNLRKNIQPIVFDKVKIEMGLFNNSWKNLVKLKIKE